MTFDEALEEIKAESEENRTLIEECERKALEYCNNEDCDNCPLWGVPCCMELLPSDE